MDKHCSCCGSIVSYVEKTKKSVSVKGEKMLVDAFERKCKHCHSTISDPVLGQKLNTAIKKGAYTSFGIPPKLIKQFRRKNKISRSELARALGYDKKEVKMFEKGKEIQPLDFRKQLTELFEVTKSEIQ